MTPTNELPRPVEDADFDSIHAAARKSLRYSAAQCRNQTSMRSDSIEFHLIHAALNWAQAELSRRETAQGYGEITTILDPDIAALIHYPRCWDTAAYPTISDAMREMLPSIFKCNEEDCPDCKPEPAKPAKCVCELADTTCGRPFVQHPERRIEYCGNRVGNGGICGHDKACHGGESD